MDLKPSKTCSRIEPIKASITVPSFFDLADLETQIVDPRRNTVFKFLEEKYSERQKKALDSLRKKSFKTSLVEKILLDDVQSTLEAYEKFVREFFFDQPPELIFRTVTLFMLYSCSMIYKAISTNKHQELENNIEQDKPLPIDNKLFELVNRIEFLRVKYGNLLNLSEFFERSSFINSLREGAFTIIGTDWKEFTSTFEDLITNNNNLLIRITAFFYSLNRKTYTVLMQEFTKPENLQEGTNLFKDSVLKEAEHKRSILVSLTKILEKTLAEKSGDKEQNFFLFQQLENSETKKKLNKKNLSLTNMLEADLEQSEKKTQRFEKEIEKNLIKSKDLTKDRTERAEKTEERTEKTEEGTEKTEEGTEKTEEGTEKMTRLPKKKKKKKKQKLLTLEEKTKLEIEQQQEELKRKHEERIKGIKNLRAIYHDLTSHLTYYEAVKSMIRSFNLSKKNVKLVSLIIHFLLYFHLASTKNLSETDYKRGEDFDKRKEDFHKAFEKGFKSKDPFNAGTLVREIVCCSHLIILFVKISPKLFSFFQKQSSFEMIFDIIRIIIYIESLDEIEKPPVKIPKFSSFENFETEFLDYVVEACKTIGNETLYQAKHVAGKKDELTRRTKNFNEAQELIADSMKKTTYETLLEAEVTPSLVRKALVRNASRFIVANSSERENLQNFQNSIVEKMKQIPESNRRALLVMDGSKKAISEMQKSMSVTLLKTYPELVDNSEALKNEELVDNTISKDKKPVNTKVSKNKKPINTKVSKEEEILNTTILEDKKLEKEVWKEMEKMSAEEEEKAQRNSQKEIEKLKPIPEEVLLKVNPVQKKVSEISFEQQKGEIQLLKNFQKEAPRLNNFEDIENLPNPLNEVQRIFSSGSSDKSSDNSDEESFLAALQSPKKSKKDLQKSNEKFQNSKDSFPTVVLNKKPIGALKEVLAKNLAQSGLKQKSYPLTILSKKKKRTRKFSTNDLTIIAEQKSREEASILLKENELQKSILNDSKARNPKEEILENKILENLAIDSEMRQNEENCHNSAENRIDNQSSKEENMTNNPVNDKTPEKDKISEDKTENSKKHPSQEKLKEVRLSYSGENLVPAFEQIVSHFFVAAKIDIDLIIIAKCFSALGLLALLSVSKAKQLYLDQKKGTISLSKALNQHAKGIEEKLQVAISSLTSEEVQAIGSVCEFLDFYSSEHPGNPFENANFSKMITNLLSIVTRTHGLRDMDLKDYCEKGNISKEFGKKFFFALYNVLGQRIVECENRFLNSGIDPQERQFASYIGKQFAPDKVLMEYLVKQIKKNFARLQRIKQRREEALANSRLEKINSSICTESLEISLEANSELQSFAEIEESKEEVFEKQESLTQASSENTKEVSKSSSKKKKQESLTKASLENTKKVSKSSSKKKQEKKQRDFLASLGQKIDIPSEPDQKSTKNEEDLNQPIRISPHLNEEIVKHPAQKTQKEDQIQKKGNKHEEEILKQASPKTEEQILPNADEEIKESQTPPKKVTPLETDNNFKVLLEILEKPIVSQEEIRPEDSEKNLEENLSNEKTPPFVSERQKDNKEDYFVEKFSQNRKRLDGIEQLSWFRNMKTMILEALSQFPESERPPLEENYDSEITLDQLRKICSSSLNAITNTNKQMAKNISLFTYELEKGISEIIPLIIEEAIEGGNPDFRTIAQETCNLLNIAEEKLLDIYNRRTVFNHDFFLELQKRKRDFCQNLQKNEKDFFQTFKTLRALELILGASIDKAETSNFHEIVSCKQHLVTWKRKFTEEIVEEIQKLQEVGHLGSYEKEFRYESKVLEESRVNKRKLS